jgi:hypothetical protein
VSAVSTSRSGGTAPTVVYVNRSKDPSGSEEAQGNKNESKLGRQDACKDKARCQALGIAGVDNLCAIAHGGDFGGVGSLLAPWVSVIRAARYRDGDSDVGGGQRWKAACRLEAAGSSSSYEGLKPHLQSVFTDRLAKGVMRCG